MFKYSVVYFIFGLFVASVVECGIYGRSSQQQSASVQSRVAYNNQAGASQYGNYDYHSNLNVNGSPGNRRNSYVNQMDQPQTGATNKILPRTGTGISAWGLITIIMLIIIIGMGGYYGIICYPLICKEERNYDIMDAASTTASANTPTRSGDFEKPGNYSSRSTTPSNVAIGIFNAHQLLQQQQQQQQQQQRLVKK